MGNTIEPPTTPQAGIHYPESDGQPMAENTLQFQWIVLIKENIDALFADDPQVFVAGDLLWYPVEGKPDTASAPDTMVVFGRPKGHRRSYRQWEEDDLAPQVVFEIRSPSNSAQELSDKLEFYEEHGVEEYYLYDPERDRLAGFMRQGWQLRPLAEMHGWESPRLGIRFDTSGEELRIYRPNGTPFRSYQELEQQVAAERQARAQAEQRAEQERQRAEHLAAKLRELGMEP